MTGFNLISDGILAGKIALFSILLSIVSCNNPTPTAQALNSNHELNRDSISSVIDSVIRSDQDSSLIYLRKTLSFAQEIKDTTLEVQILFCLGFNTKIELDSGFYYFGKALNAARSIHDSVSMARIYFMMFMNLYSANFQTGREDGTRMNMNALAYGDSALQLYSQLPPSKRILECIGRMAEFHMYLGNYEKTQFYLDSGYRTLKSKGFKDSDAEMFNGVNIEFCIKTERYDLALQYLNDKIALNKINEDWPGLSYFYSMAGKAWAGKKNMNLALKYADSAMQIANKYQLRKEYIDGITALYEIHKQGGDYKNALQYHERLMQLIDSLNTQYQVQNAANFTAKLEAEHKEKALELLRKDKIIDEQIKDEQRNAMIYLMLGLILASSVAFLLYNRFALKKKALDQSDKLLQNILPVEVAEELKAKGHADAKLFDEVTVMFTDIVDFTRLSETLSAQELVKEIDACFGQFDTIVGKYGIEKIKTIGDSYMAAGGIPTETDDHATAVVNVALEIQEFMKQRNTEKQNSGGVQFVMRIGIHTGPVVAGIVGVRKFAYDIWGDTVNIASRLESAGEGGMVNISASTMELIKDKFDCIPRGKISVKNKGDLEMYFVKRPA